MVKCLSSNKFKKIAQDVLSGNIDKKYSLVSVDFDNFKYLNDLFGYKFGDTILNSLSTHFSAFLEDGELFTRINADNFIFLILGHNNDDIIKKFTIEIDASSFLSNLLPTHHNFILSGGIYNILDGSDKLSSMIDKADFARKRAKGNYISTVCVYDKKVSEELMMRKEITLTMESALKNEEFEMYLQPKYSFKTKKIIGAEALVRWNSKKNGMIFPDKFIPIMEQNGYIRFIDFYMLEKACKFINRLKKMDIVPLPISVNFSKVHVRNVNFVNNLKNIVINKYNIPPNLIEVEFTESAFASDFERLINITNSIKDSGFKVSLDDFGSAYSSLNTLKDLPVDIVKLDKSFLSQSTDTEKGRFIIAKVIEMIKSLKMITVMEGVEQEEQANFLQRFSCDIGQGYYFARPMPEDNFFDLLKSEDIKTDAIIEQNDLSEIGYDIPQEFLLDNWDLFVIGNNINIGIMKGEINGNVTIRYINKMALDYFGCTREDFDKSVCKNFDSLVYSEDLEYFKNFSEQIINVSKPVNFRFRIKRKDGTVIWINGKASSSIDNEGRRIGFFVFQDITDENERLNQLENNYKSKFIELENIYANMPGGIIRCNCDDLYSIKFVNECFLRSLGYSSNEVVNTFGNSFLNIIDERDRINFYKFIVSCGYDAENTFEFRIKNKDNVIKWFACRGNIYYYMKGSKELFLVAVDITKEKANREKLEKSEEKFKLLVEQSKDIAYEWDFENDSTIVSNRFLEVFGYKFPEKIRNNHNLIKHIHPEDVEKFKMWTENTFRKKHSPVLEIRVKNIKEEYVWIRSRATIICNEKDEPSIAIGAFTDITKEKEAIDYLLKKAQQDPLTKLYNKGESEKLIQNEIDLNPNVKGALAIIDVDNFKGVNDSLGHQFGDMVLQDVAFKIKNLILNDAIIGRLGGDEFVIYIKNINDNNKFLEIINELTLTINNSYFGDEKKYDVTGSVGIAFYPEHGKNFSELYKNADSALYQAKADGKNCLRIYDEDMSSNYLCDRTPLVEADRLVGDYFKDDIIYLIFEMLYETSDISTTINKILQLLGDSFKVDRVYIFEHSDDMSTTSNTYEWCAKGIVEEKNNLQKISLESMDSFFNSYTNDGIFYSNNIDSLDETSYNIMAPQGIKSFIHVGLYKEGRFKGFVGFDDCGNERMWKKSEIATLSYIARILSIFIFNRQISKDLLDSYQNYTGMLDNLNGYVYVIDIETYEILYTNNASKSYLRLGKKCYMEAFGSNCVCEKCPVSKLKGDVLFASEQIYSQKLNRWIISSASSITWTNNKKVALVNCIDISNYK